LFSPNIGDEAVFSCAVDAASHTGKFIKNQLLIESKLTAREKLIITVDQRSYLDISKKFNCSFLTMYYSTTTIT